MSNKSEALKSQHGDATSDNESGDDELGPNVADLGAVEYPENERQLHQPYCLWFSKQPNRLLQVNKGYSQSLRLIAQVATVEQWWALYSHLDRLQEIAPDRDVHLFKKGIMPMREDPANQKGGKWVIRLRKDYGSRAWENLCLAMLDEQFMVGDELCCVVVSTRYQEGLLNVWNRRASDSDTTARIRDALKRLLNMPASAIMEYTCHSDCLEASKTVTPNNSCKS